VQADLRSIEATQLLADQALELFGTIDILVNNAGTLSAHPKAFARDDQPEAGLNLHTQTMAAEWGRYNIQSNAIAPTVILTELGQQVWGEASTGGAMKAPIPAGRFGEPREVADLLLLLASNASNFICGQVIRLHGGLSVV